MQDKKKIRNRLFFSRANADLEKRVKNVYIRGDAAILPCRVTAYDDVISHYSVHEYETLNPEFGEYVEDAISFIPPEYPVLLEIVGCDFTEEEQETIRSTIEEDFMYELGAVQEQNSQQNKIMLFMLAGMILTWLFVSFWEGLSEMSLEFIYIVFWFFADLVISYVFLDNPESLHRRVLAGRLARIKVSFVQNVEDCDKELENMEEEIKMESQKL